MFSREISMAAPSIKYCPPLSMEILFMDCAHLYWFSSIISVRQKYKKSASFFIMGQQQRSILYLISLFTSTLRIGYGNILTYYYHTLAYQIKYQTNKSFKLFLSFLVK